MLREPERLPPVPHQYLREALRLSVGGSAIDERDVRMIERVGFLFFGGDLLRWFGSGV